MNLNKSCFCSIETKHLLHDIASIIKLFFQTLLVIRHDWHYFLACVGRDVKYLVPARKVTFGSFPILTMSKLLHTGQSFNFLTFFLNEIVKHMKTRT